MSDSEKPINATLPPPSTPCLSDHILFFSVHREALFPTAEKIVSGVFQEPPGERLCVEARGSSSPRARSGLGISSPAFVLHYLEASSSQLGSQRPPLACSSLTALRFQVSGQFSGACLWFTSNAKSELLGQSAFPHRRLQAGWPSTPTVLIQGCRVGLQAGLHP